MLSSSILAAKAVQIGKQVDFLFNCNFKFKPRPLSWFAIFLIAELKMSST